MDEILIEFEDLKDDSSYINDNKKKSSGIRRDFRIPLDDRDDIFVEIQGDRYKLKNISIVGFKILAPDIKLLSLDKVYEFKLYLQNTIIMGNCIIRYFQKDDEDRFWGGVEIISMNDINEKKLNNELSKLKKEILNVGKSNDRQ